jgi:hypothetical protein
MTIQLLMDLIRPDRGSVTLLGVGTGNSPRALVPGYGLDLTSTGVLLLMSVVLLKIAASAFRSRDRAAELWVRRSGLRAGRPTRVQRPMLKSAWTAALLQGRFGLLAGLPGRAGCR